MTKLSRIEAFLGAEYFDKSAVSHLFEIENNRKLHTDGWMNSFKNISVDFYRKGEIGDYKNHFISDNLITFQKWENELIGVEDNTSKVI
jgi:hypothetical protein